MKILVACEYSGRVRVDADYTNLSEQAACAGGACEI